MGLQNSIIRSRAELEKSATSIPNRLETSGYVNNDIGMLEYENTDDLWHIRGKHHKNVHHGSAQGVEGY